MNNINTNFNDSLVDENEISILQIVSRYLFFWKYFVISICLCFFIAFLFVKYSTKLYDTNAKIQILDPSASQIEMLSAEELFNSSKINIENEITILGSTPIIEKVIKNLQLNIYVEAVGEIKTSRVSKFPFSYTSLIDPDSITNNKYKLTLEDDKLLIENLEDNTEYIFNKNSTIGVQHDLPFEIFNVNKNKWNLSSYNLNFVSNAILIEELKNKIVIKHLGKNSEIISLKLRHPNLDFSKNVLNELIKVFNNDGVNDRQLVYKRTIDFVNERYMYLSYELDSIEIDKKRFKIKNDLIDLPSNSTITLEKSLKSNEEIFSNSNQIFIVSNLLDELSKIDIDLLPSNIGIQNIEINQLIQSYNTILLEQRKLITSAGPNNPSILQLNNLISDTRTNIIFSLRNYLSQLKIINKKLTSKQTKIENEMSNLPNQEMILRGIERNQLIKESLYLFLLQKGEEAQVSYAITEPSIKVVEYANSSSEPVHPRRPLIFIGAFLISIIIPFVIIYFIFLFDTKIHSIEDFEKYSLNILGEIPFFDLPEKEKVFDKPSDRSIISESSRMLMSNVRYLEKNDSESNVILVTSSIKGEGKTLSVLNLALSFSSIGKKVLLIGADLRNPQLHKYVDLDKSISGLTDYLVNNNLEWKKSVINPFDNQSLDILLSGPLPPNPLNLINNGNISSLLKEARKLYDYILIDSAPTLLVADTKSLFNYSDIILFVTRCNVTDRKILNHISDFSNENDNNVGVILNGVGQQNSYGYSYGYRYGYGYNYKYSYNYGYGYGYGEEES